MEEAVISVSYTHLDVYKRQQYMSVRKANTPIAEQMVTGIRGNPSVRKRNTGIQMTAMEILKSAIKRFMLN